MQFKTRNRETPLIEIAPLIDVVFLLLLFFMVTTQFTTAPGLQIALPEIKPGAPVTTTAKINVSITAAGDIYVAGNPVPAEDLKEALKKAASDLASTIVILTADKDVSHGKIVSVMDTLRDLGIKKMVIAARWKAEPKKK
ncbi:MAG: biopolymer transporter ExbD [Deltaproteobacteria bacterium]|nr:biopolymer transporter ExbD [Deltaproteobacteria bacterium]